MRRRRQLRSPPIGPAPSCREQLSDASFAGGLALIGFTTALIGLFIADRAKSTGGKVVFGLAAAAGVITGGIGGIAAWASGADY